MNNNIFEGAKFGDKFVTRDGRVAILTFQNENCVKIIFENSDQPTIYLKENNGNYASDFNIGRNLDIVSRYQEPITNKEIDEDKIILTKEELTQIKIREYDWGFEAGSSKDSEPIDEEKLCIDKCYATNKYIPIENEGGNSEIASIRRCSFSDGFELGYRKAMEG